MVLNVCGQATVHIVRAVGELDSAMNMLKNVDTGSGSPEESVRLRLRKIVNDLRGANQEIILASDDYYEMRRPQ